MLIFTKLPCRYVCIKISCKILTELRIIKIKKCPKMVPRNSTVGVAKKIAGIIDALVSRETYDCDYYCFTLFTCCKYGTLCCNWCRSRYKEFENDFSNTSN